MLSVAVQAGGSSRRMGRDKALLDFGGQRLIQRVVDRLRPLADEIFVTSGGREGYAFLEIPSIPDLFPGRAALGGVYTALKVARHPLVALVACDMPFVSRELLAHQCDLLETGAFDAVVPRNDDGPQPFHAVYRRTSCLPAAEAALQAGELRLASWLSHLNVRFLTPAEIAPYDPNGTAFLNVNTPDDLKTVLRYLSATTPAKQSSPKR